MGCVGKDLCNYHFCKTRNKCLYERKKVRKYKKQKRQPQKLSRKKAPAINNKNPKENSFDKKKLRMIELSKLYPKRVVSLIVHKGKKAECCCCESKEELTYDHVLPVSMGGSNSLDNGQILCQECNQLKADRIITIERLRKEKYR